MEEWDAVQSKWVPSLPPIRVRAQHCVAETPIRFRDVFWISLSHADLWDEERKEWIPISEGNWNLPVYARIIRTADGKQFRFC